MKMSAFEDFVAIISKTQPMQELLGNLREEPARILNSICKEYEAANKAVPDHHLPFAGYFTEVSIKALLSAGLITAETGGMLSLYQYKPTELGLEHYKKMLSEKNA